MADERYLVAVASSDGIVVNNHFGHATTFYIYEVTDESVSFIEKREVTPVCHLGEHDDDKLQENASVLSDCEYLLVSKVGDGARAVLESKGITCYEIPGFIPESIDKMQRYEKVKNLFS